MPIRKESLSYQRGESNSLEVRRLAAGGLKANL